MDASVETRIVDRLMQRFSDLREAGRCAFGHEVRLLSWGHISEGHPLVMRADFVCSWDGGPLIAVEVKGRFEDRTDLGKALSQSADYARAQIGANDATLIPNGWVGKPIWAAALAFDAGGSSERVRQAKEQAHRLYGPRNVGFLSVEKQGLTFRLGEERYWSQERGWRTDAFVRGYRAGSTRKDAP